MCYLYVLTAFLGVLNYFKLVSISWFLVFLPIAIVTLLLILINQLLDYLNNKPVKK